MSAIETLAKATDILRDNKTRTAGATGRLDAQLAVINADRIDRSFGLTKPSDGSNGLTLAGNIVAATGKAKARRAHLPAPQTPPPLATRGARA